MKYITLSLVALILLVPGGSLFAQDATDTPNPALTSEQTKETPRDDTTKDRQETLQNKLKEQKQKREERRSMVQEKRASRRHAIAVRIGEKLERLHDRIEHISGRIESAIGRFRDRDMDVSESQTAFDEGIAHLADAGTSITAVIAHVGTWDIDTMTAEEIKAKIKEEEGMFRTLVNVAREDLKESRNAFKQAIRNLKAKIDSATDAEEVAENTEADDQTGDEDADSNSDSTDATTTAE